MIEFVRNFFTKHLVLKILSLFFALLVWFYIVNELNNGSLEEFQALRRIMPTEGLIAKKLAIKPVFIGSPQWGYKIDQDKATVVPEYCIVVGTKNALRDIKCAYTMPIDVKKTSKSFTTPVALNPIAPGVYMEETVAQVTVPVEKAASL